MRGGGGGCWACFRSGPISVGGGGGSKRSAPLFPGPQEEPAHGLHPRFVVAEIWADRVVCMGRSGTSTHAVYALSSHFCYVAGFGNLGDPVVPTLRGVSGDVVTLYAC